MFFDLLAAGNLLVLIYLAFQLTMFRKEVKVRSRLEKRLENFESAFKAFFTLVKAEFPEGDKKKEDAYLLWFLKEIEKRLGFTSETFSLLDVENQVLRLRFDYQFPQEYVNLKKTLFPSKPARSIDGFAFSTKQPVVSNDTIHDPTLRYFTHLTRFLPFKSYLCAPVVFKGRSIGLFLIGDYHFNRFGIYEVRVLMIVANYLGLNFKVIKTWNQ
jgi:GAF domain-containing protein